MNESTSSPIRHYSKAEVKAQAIREIENLITSGSKVRAAIEKVAQRTGISERSLWTYLEKTRGIPHAEREAALGRKRQAPRRKRQCNPAALKRFIDLCLSRMTASAAYRQVEIEAADNGWGELPSERTMRRKLDEQVSWSERLMARRTSDSSIGGAVNV